MRPILLLLSLLVGLGAPAAPAGWTLPSALDALFAKPTAAEIEAVREEWRTRDLRPAEVKVVEVALSRSSARRCR